MLTVSFCSVVTMQCPESISTCVNNHKLIDFLAMKFIPGRSLLPEDAHTGIVSEGHIFTEKTIPADPRVLMADFVAYILGRPKEAVPHDVRPRSVPALRGLSIADAVILSLFIRILLFPYQYQICVRQERENTSIIDHTKGSYIFCPKRPGCNSINSFARITNRRMRRSFFMH